MFYIMVYEKIIWNDFSCSPAGVSLRDETNKALILSYRPGHFYDLLPCKSPFGLPSAFKFDPVKFSGSFTSRTKQHSKKVNGGFHGVKEAFCFFATMRCLMNELF